MALAFAAARRDKFAMQTLTLGKARKNLNELLSRALRGEDIGILDAVTGQIVALRPMRVYSEDYAWTEYGLTPAQMTKAVRNIKRRARQEKTKLWDGTKA